METKIRDTINKENAIGIQMKGKTKANEEVNSWSSDDGRKVIIPKIMIVKAGYDPITRDDNVKGTPFWKTNLLHRHCTSTKVKRLTQT